MKNYVIAVITVLIFSLFYCKDQNNPLPLETVKHYDITGQAQIGPFMNGSDVNVYELDRHFDPTGRSYHTNTDEKGHFEWTGIKLVSPYVEVVADGFYYNGVTGEMSNERITLKAISDLSLHKILNVNILTNLESERIKYLITSKRSSIRQAKIESQKELLKVFNIDSIQIDNAESLDIVNSGEPDAILLAVSSILQANRSTAELTKLQADMILDMKEDGILGDTILQNSLFTQSVGLDLQKIRQNLVSRYAKLGIALTTINNFDRYISYFNLHSTFHFNPSFEYPASTLNGINLLAINAHKLQAYTFYSLAVKMPTTGQIKIKIKMTDGIGPWWYLASENYGWKVDPYDQATGQQEFISTINGEIIDLPLAFSAYGTAIVEYYCKPSSAPTFTKAIHWGDYNDLGFEFKDNSPLRPNLLALKDSLEIKGDTPYVIGAAGNSAYRLKFKLRFPASITPQVLGGSGFYTYTFMEGYMEFDLASSEYGDTTFISGVSEIALKFKGTGKITIESNLLMKEGVFLKRTCFIL